MVQHVSPACRAAWKSNLYNLAAAKILRRVNDRHVDECNAYKDTSLGAASLLVVFLPTCLSFGSITLGDYTLDSLVTSFFAFFVLANTFVYQSSSSSGLGGLYVSIFYMFIFVSAVCYFFILYGKKNGRFSRPSEFVKPTCTANRWQQSRRSRLSSGVSTGLSSFMRRIRKLFGLIESNESQMQVQLWQDLNIGESRKLAEIFSTAQSFPNAVEKMSIPYQIVNMQLKVNSNDDIIINTLPKDKIDFHSSNSNSNSISISNSNSISISRSMSSIFLQGQNIIDQGNVQSHKIVHVVRRSTSTKVAKLVTSNIDLALRRILTSLHNLSYLPISPFYSSRDMSLSFENASDILSSSYNGPKDEYQKVLVDCLHTYHPGGFELNEEEKIEILESFHSFYDRFVPLPVPSPSSSSSPSSLVHNPTSKSPGNPHCTSGLDFGDFVRWFKAISSKVAKVKAQTDLPPTTNRSPVGPERFYTIQNDNPFEFESSSNSSASISLGMFEKDSSIDSSLNEWFVQSTSSGSKDSSVNSAFI